MADPLHARLRPDPVAFDRAGSREALRESGSSLLTLGFASHLSPRATGVYFVAALTGLIVVALQIAYLPTIYADVQPARDIGDHFAEPGRRTGMGAGVPRPPSDGGLDGEPPQLLRGLGGLVADVMESHATYPS